MDEGYSNLPTSHLLGSVPAVTQDDRKLGPPAAQDAAATSRLQEFPPGGGNVGGYRPPGGPADGDVENQADWKGYFNVASYAPYFNVDTDVVVDRLISSVYPMDGFYRKIDANPDMYGPLWITTTLIFMLAVFVFWITPKSCSILVYVGLFSVYLHTCICTFAYSCGISSMGHHSSCWWCIILVHHFKFEGMH
ncbi:Integral membrane Yip1 family protein [Zea mays]|uniref:Integral membrane Yip1 family protein n=1 Tax=Zea mays TaxID=4577 RepID=A0A1D6M5R2_MAIZE|nr:Integral membrane Yip1 family protein [Zea mays]